MAMGRATGIVLLVALTTHACPADVPRRWRYTLSRPFGHVTVAASTEEKDLWPAYKALHVDTSEPEGIWQTLRNSPESAWLALRLTEPERVKGVRLTARDPFAVPLCCMCALPPAAQLQACIQVAVVLRGDDRAAAQVVS